MLRATLRLTVVVAALTALPSRLFASPVVIDFETLTEGDAITNQFAGLTFSNATVLTAGSLLNELEFPPFSGVNVATDDGGTMTIDFASPISGFGGYFTYVQRLLLKGFDSTSTLLGSASSLFNTNLALSGEAGSSPNELIQLAFGNISHVTITGNAAGDSFVIDNLTYTPLPAQAVPEPATASLLLLGVAVLTRVRRRV